jgi:DNA-directed RNA polymerase sigma subunit (sigma70/sigma32)
MKNIDRTKDIVKMRKAGCTFQLIGTKYGISRQRVQKIYSNYLKQQKPNLLDRIINWYWRKRIIEPDARED